MGMLKSTLVLIKEYCNGLFRVQIFQKSTPFKRHINVISHLNTKKATNHAQKASNASHYVKFIKYKP